jgi:hypothetical protein
MVGRTATHTIAEVVADELANWSWYDLAAASMSACNSDVAAMKRMATTSAPSDVHNAEFKLAGRCDWFARSPHHGAEVGTQATRSFRIAELELAPQNRRSLLATRMSQRRGAAHSRRSSPRGRLPILSHSGRGAAHHSRPTILAEVSEVVDTQLPDRPCPTTPISR